MATVATRPPTDPLATKRGLGRLLSRSASSRRVVTKTTRGVDRSQSTRSLTSRSVVSHDTLSTSLSSACSRSNVKSSLRKSNKSSTKSVRFKSVSIREHVVEPTNNPSVTAGPALGLSWQYADMNSYDLNQYETARPARRTRAEFQMPRSVREAILKRNGHSAKEVQQVVRLTNIARKQRRATIMAQEVEDLHVAVEWVGRKFKKAVGARSSSDKEMESLWKKASKAETKRAMTSMDPPDEVETRKPVVQRSLSTRSVTTSKATKSSTKSLSSSTRSAPARLYHDDANSSSDDECAC